MDRVRPALPALAIIALFVALVWFVWGPPVNFSLFERIRGYIASADLEPGWTTAWPGQSLSGEVTVTHTTDDVVRNVWEAVDRYRAGETGFDETRERIKELASGTDSESSSTAELEPPSANDAEAFAAGKAAYQAYDNDRAAAILLPLAEAGYPGAAYYSGRLFHRGGMEQARAFYRLAYEISHPLPEAGDAEAQYRVGKILSFGEGGLEDRFRAFAFLLRAAEQGHPKAQYEVGYSYEGGWCVTENTGAAFEWYWRAAMQGLADAYNEIGYLYCKGEGVDRDSELGLAWEALSYLDCPHNLSRPVILDELLQARCREHSYVLTPMAKIVPAIRTAEQLRERFDLPRPNSSSDDCGAGNSGLFRPGDSVFVTLQSPELPRERDVGLLFLTLDLNTSFMPKHEIVVTYMQELLRELADIAWLANQDPDVIQIVQNKISTLSVRGGSRSGEFLAELQERLVDGLNNPEQAPWVLSDEALLLAKLALVSGTELSDISTRPTLDGRVAVAFAGTIFGDRVIVTLDPLAASQLITLIYNVWNMDDAARWEPLNDIQDELRRRWPPDFIEVPA
jgi:hypothetical protein